MHQQSPHDEPVFNIKLSASEKNSDDIDQSFSGIIGRLEKSTTTACNEYKVTQNTVATLPLNNGANKNLIDEKASGVVSTQSCRREDSNLRYNIHFRCENINSPDLDIKNLRENSYLIRYKRLFDLLGASLILATSFPLWLPIALIIKLDSHGPVFFLQDRTGFRGRRFVMYKFRTMYADAEDRKKDLLHLNAHGKNSPDFKIPEDPRITRTGKFLRKTSLDELPNLINVIKGEMSLVGPRPTSFHASTYDSWHLSRLAVKPGITGLWQISGRADISFNERIALDVQYIKNISFMYDLQLLVKTLLKFHKGAY